MHTQRRQIVIGVHRCTCEDLVPLRSSCSPVWSPYRLCVVKCVACDVMLHTDEVKGGVACGVVCCMWVMCDAGSTALLSHGDVMAVEKECDPFQWGGVKRRSGASCVDRVEFERETPIAVMELSKRDSGQDPQTQKLGCEISHPNGSR